MTRYNRVSFWQPKEGHLEPLTFIPGHHVLSHAEPDSWNVLSWDASSKVLLVPDQGSRQPPYLLAFQLWKPSFVLYRLVRYVVINRILHILTRQHPYSFVHCRSSGNTKKTDGSTIWWQWPCHGDEDKIDRLIVKQLYSRSSSNYCRFCLN